MLKAKKVLDSHLLATSDCKTTHLTATPGTPQTVDDKFSSASKKKCLVLDSSDGRKLFVVLWLSTFVRHSDEEVGVDASNNAVEPKRKKAKKDDETQGLSKKKRLSRLRFSFVYQ